MNYINILLGLLLINFTLLASNSQETKCAGNIPQSSVQAQTGGLYKPSSSGVNEYMKTLVVFVQFDETDVDINNATWPKDQLPTWADNLISSSPSSNHPDFTISDYFKDMSMGSFDFIGDVYPNLVIINTEEYYRTNGYHFGDCNKDALTQINPYVDFSEYDNWGFNSLTNSFEFVPDGYVDMIIMIYRTPSNDGGWFDAGESDFNAIAVLSGSGNTYTLNFDGVNILAKRSLEHLGSGLTIKKGMQSLTYTLPILAHEYGHYLFGYNHGNTGGIMSGSYAFHAVERERLGYISYTNCTQNNFADTLKDFIEYGDVLKIPIPITNPNSTTFFLVENHQKLSKYDQIIRGGSIGGGYDYTGTGSGIYVWLVKNGGNSPISNVYYEAVTADGRWDWTYVDDYYAGPGWYVGKSYEGYLPKTKREAVNRNTGKTDKKEEHYYWNGHYASKWVDDRPTGSYQLTRNVMGDEFDAFNFDYNELLTPWSNPSTYVNGDTDISIQLYNQDGSDIIVKVFTTEASAFALPPSKTQNLHFSYSNPYHPSLCWDSNIEDDMFIYRIYRNYDNIGWDLAGTVIHPSNTFIDYSVDYTKPIWAKSVKYYVIAIDSTDLPSVPSEQVEISGIMIPQYKISSESNHTLTEFNIYFKLYDNFPNPFNPETNISFSLPERSFVTLKIYDSLGREIKELVNDFMEKGNYAIRFNGSNLSSGIYFYKLTAGKNNSIKKMLLVK